MSQSFCTEEEYKSMVAIIRDQAAEIGHLKSLKPKIIQIQAMPNDEYYQGRCLGLADNGVTYMLGNGGMWEFYIGAELCKEQSK